MKTNFQKLVLTFGRLDSRHVRLALALITLALFALSAGAPEIAGEIGR